MAVSRHSGRRRNPEAAVRVGTIMALPGMLGRFGIQPEAVLSQLGLPPDLFDDPDNLIGFAPEGEHAGDPDRAPMAGTMKSLGRPETIKTRVF